MMLWHVSLLPLVVGAIVVVHIVLVRRRGVAPPIGSHRAGTSRLSRGTEAAGSLL